MRVTGAVPGMETPWKAAVAAATIGGLSSIGKWIPRGIETSVNSGKRWRHFARACETGDVAALTALLDPGVQGLFDSGGHIPGAPTDAVHGALTVAPILIGAFDDTDARFLPTTVNGGPGVLVTLDGTIVSVISLAIRDGLITHVHGIGNPNKLAHLTIPDADGPDTTPH